MRGYTGWRRGEGKYEIGGRMGQGRGLGMRGYVGEMKSEGAGGEGRGRSEGGGGREEG